MLKTSQTCLYLILTLIICGLVSCGSRMSHRSFSPVDNTDALQEAEAGTTKTKNTRDTLRPKSEDQTPNERDLGKGADKEPLGDDKTTERDLGKGADKEPKPSAP